MGLPEVVSCIVRSNPSRIWRTGEVGQEVRKRPAHARVTDAAVSAALNLAATMNIWSSARNFPGIMKVKWGHWQWRWFGVDLDWV